MRKKYIILVTILSFTICLSSCEGIFIFDSSELISILNSLNYKFSSSSTSGSLPITDDIQIIGTVTILSEQMEVPDECTGEYDFCRQSVGFEDKYGADGITVAPLSDEYLYPPSSLTLTNVKLRFRPLIINTGPWEYNYVPVIQLMPPSDYECEDTQTRCEVDQVCYDSYYSYCISCLALSQEKCRCRDENGIFNAGTPCMMIGGDVVYDGECQDGECVIEGWD